MAAIHRPLRRIRRGTGPARHRSPRLGGPRAFVPARSRATGPGRPHCFGDHYPFALCVANEEVRDYVELFAAEAVRDVPIAGVSIESCGQLGMAHNGLHEKTVGAYPPAAGRILSVCCCGGCRRNWAAGGVDPDTIAERLRDALKAVQGDDRKSLASMDTLLGADIAELLLTTRLANQEVVRAQVLAAVRGVAPAARLTMHGQVDPWATGPSPAMTAQALAAVDAVLVPAWSDSPATREAISTARRLAPDQVAVAAYVTALPPADESTVVDHAAALVAAGADELHLYHLGLANQSQLEVIGRTAQLGC